VAVGSSDVAKCLYTVGQLKQWIMPRARLFVYNIIMVCKVLYVVIFQCVHSCFYFTS
jgi:hypothetical protein